MTHKYKLIFISVLTVTLSLASASLAHGQTLPSGKGKAEFERICSGCHSVTIATRQRMTSLRWLGVVSDMASRGAQGSAEDFQNIVTYLGTNFGEGAPIAPDASSSSPAVSKEVPLSEAEKSKASEILKSNGCMSCHRIDGTGSYLGPNLTEIGAHRSSEQIRTSLLSPNKAVLPENRSVQLVTQDGRSVRGKLLNQDGFSVQMIDSSDQLVAFKKSDLKEFTVVTSDPMPSYANKLSTQDLTNIVHYLSSLKVHP